MSEEMSLALLELVRQRQAELDGAVAVWREERGSGVRLWCGEHCANCCVLTVNVTLPEAVSIAVTLNDHQRGQLQSAATRLLVHAGQSADTRDFLAGYREAVGPCPFLDSTGNCAIYPLRPLACRALLSTRPAAWCGVNLGKLPEWERQNFLDSLDCEVVAWPTHYAAEPQELAAGFERGLIFAMIRTLGYGVTGNLIALTSLVADREGDQGLMTQGEILREQIGRLDSFPFLVQVHEP